MASITKLIYQRAEERGIEIHKRLSKSGARVVIFPSDSDRYKEYRYRLPLRDLGIKLGLVTIEEIDQYDHLARCRVCNKLILSDIVCSNIQCESKL